jgi:hypothetical protein
MRQNGRHGPQLTFPGEPMKTLATPLFLMTLFCAAGSHASDRPDHFKGLESATLEEAVTNLSEANASLDALLQQQELSLSDLASVHQLSYTMENALQKISAELEQMSIELEAVHVASEHADLETVRAQGRNYLQRAQKLLPAP